MVAIQASNVSKPGAAGSRAATMASTIMKGLGRAETPQHRAAKAHTGGEPSGITSTGRKDVPRSDGDTKSMDNGSHASHLPARSSYAEARPSHAETREDTHLPPTTRAPERDSHKSKRSSEAAKRPAAVRDPLQRDVPATASSQDSDPIAIMHALRDITSASDTPALVRDKITHVAARYEAMVAEHTQKMKHLQRTISGLQREKSLAAARDLTIDSFDNSIDRVSEGDIRASVQGLNSSIDEFVMNVVDSATTKPANPKLANVKVSSTSPIYTAFYGLGVDDEHRGLLMEADLHEGITKKLHAQFFRGNLGVSLTTPLNTENLELFYANAIVGKESWKVSQRWRSITASGISAVVKVDAWDAEIAPLAKVILDHLSHGLCREEVVLGDLHPVVLAGLRKIHDEAFILSTMVKRDVLSSKMLVVVSPSTQRMPIIDLARVDVQWPMSEGPPAKQVLGTYSFGLVKSDESGSTTVLLRPKVVTNQLIRHPSPSGKTHTQPSTQPHKSSKYSHGTKS